MVLTVRLYAERKEWPVEQIEVRASRQSTGPSITHIETELILGGTLTAEQEARLRDVAARCPVTRALTGGVQITHR